MSKNADTTIVIENERLMKLCAQPSDREVFLVAIEHTSRPTRCAGIADTIMLPSLINLDFADAGIFVMRDAGTAVINLSATAADGSIGVEKAIKV